MSDTKPRIYGTCAAGCLWETVHKDDLRQVVSEYKVSVTDNTAEVDVGLESAKFKVKTNYIPIVILKTTTDNYFLQKVIGNAEAWKDLVNLERGELTLEIISQSFDPDANTFSYTYEVSDGATYHRASGTISNLNGTTLKECRIEFIGVEEVYIINPLVKGRGVLTETEKQEIAQKVYDMIKAGE
jgi:hypothetical protein